MEKLNINFSGSDNIAKTICWILSFLSWLLLIVTGWIGVYYLSDKHIIWIIASNFMTGDKDVDNALNKINYFPMRMHDALLYTVFIIALAFATIGFILYVYFCTCGKNSYVMEGMLGKISRFHFISIVCAAALFCIGISVTESKLDETINAMSFCFSIIGLLTTVFFAYKSNLDSAPSYVNFIIKKGTFGSFIALFVYNCCISILFMGIYDKIKKITLLNFLSVMDDIYSFYKGCGIGFSIAIGVVNLLISFLLKDVVIATINLLIYIGATIHFFNLDEDVKSFFNGSADGIIDIIMIVLSAAIIGLLIFTQKGLLAHK